MILTGDIGEALRAQPVGERMRRVLFEIGGGEEIGHLAFKSGPLALRTQAGRRLGVIKVKSAIEELAKNLIQYCTHMGHAPVPIMYNYFI